ncbi:recombination protein NinG [Paraburkholderia tropica]|uniref:recombination protein NinG n=1 Tax=Paraburkholderia tropica TaxID=92647 RepID=UPI003D2B1FD7
MRRFLVGVRSFGSMEGGLIRTSLPIKKALKPKRCRHCGNSYTPISSMSKACSTPCAIALMEKDKAKKADRAKRDERKSIRQALEKAKTRGRHLKELQAAFNAWIRMRDAGLPCISCGRPASWRGQWDAGHFRSVGSNPASRFDPANVAKQCGPCNRYLSGNLLLMREGLIKRIGLAEVERLEGPREPLKLTIPEIIEMKAHYRAEVRRMKKEQLEMEPA